jgi:hypothetical protein
VFSRHRVIGLDWSTMHTINRPGIQTRSSIDVQYTLERSAFTTAAA